MKERAPKKAVALDFNSPESLKEFKRAAERWTREVIKSGAGLDVLVREGIYTKSGKLSKNYR